MLMEKEKGYRARLQNFIPLVVILLFWLLSLLVRFVFQLEGIGLTVFEAINEIIKVVLSIGIAWLILKNVSVPISKKKFPRIEVIVGLLLVGIWLVILYFAFVGTISLSILWSLLITVGVPIIFSIRHYSREELGFFTKDLGLSIPTIRTFASFVVTLIVLFSLISISAGENSTIFFRYYTRSISFGGRLMVMFERFLIGWLWSEELFFRVFLQTRLEKLMPIGWAILIQALLFSLVHIPSNAIGLGWGWEFLPHFANQILVINGLIGGYLWYKTRNLPVLVLYHWTIYPLLPLIFFPSYYLHI